MGSYLSIVNNTPETWQCKIGPDEAAIKIAGIAISAVAGAAAVIGTAGAAAPFAASIAGGVSVGGVASSALATITAGAAAVSTTTSIIGGVSGFGIAVAKGISDKLKDQGYETIAPGKSHRYGKMSLSLWQQGTCVRTVIVNERTVRAETVYMRPIFSGATDNSELKHEIQFWLNKFGTEKTDITAQNSGRSLKEEDDSVDSQFFNGTLQQ